MKIRYWSALLVLCLAAAAAAQQQVDPKAMMEAWEKAGTPGDAQKKLDVFVGNWDVKVKTWMMPDAPPAESTGVAENRWILGGRYLEQKFQSSFMNQPFSGIGYTAYDNVKKHYVGTWMDSMSTGIMFTAGVADDTGKIMKFTGTMDDPMSGQSMRLEEKIVVMDRDNHMMEMWTPAPTGQMYKSMEIHYKRRP
jgi:hypothetical protein